MICYVAYVYMNMYTSCTLTNIYQFDTFKVLPLPNQHTIIGSVQNTHYIINYGEILYHRNIIRCIHALFIHIYPNGVCPKGIDGQTSTSVIIFMAFVVLFRRNILVSMGFCWFYLHVGQQIYFSRIAEIWYPIIHIWIYLWSLEHIYIYIYIYTDMPTITHFA